MRAVRAAAVVAALVVATPVPVAAQTGTAPARPAQTTTTVPSAPGSLLVASQTTWVQPRGEFLLRLKVATAENPADLQLDVAVRGRVANRTQFQQTLEGRLPPGTLRSTSGALDKLPLDAAGAIQVRLGPPDLAATRPGVYPVEVTLRKRRARTPLDRVITHLVALPERIDGPELATAVVLPVHAPPSLRADGTRALPDTSGIEALVETLQAQAYRSLPLTVVPTPETLEGLAAGDEGARALATGISDAVGGRHAVVGTYVPVDVTALDAAGLLGELPRQLDQGATSAAAVIGVTADRTTWVAEDRLDDTGLDGILDEGMRRVVVAENLLAPQRPPAPLPNAPFSIQARNRTVPALAADGALAAHFRSGGDQVLAAHRLLAELASIWLERPANQRGVVVMAPRAWKPSRPFLDALLTGVASSPVVAPASVEMLFASVPPAMVRRSPLLRSLPIPVRPGTGGLAAGAVSAARGGVDALSSTVEPDPATDLLSRQILVSESSELRSSAARREYLDAVRATVDRQLHAIELPATRSITLTARTGDIPLTFRNNSDRPMTVLARVESDKLGFRGEAEQRVELPPRKSTTVRFGVRARTSGTFPVEVTLTSPRGGVTLASTRFTVRSTAASGLGIALSIASILFLGVWWARHLFRGRRARALVPA